MQIRMKNQLKFHKTRFNYLNDYWKYELEEYKQELKKSKNGKRLLLSFKKINEMTVSRFLYTYLERCKYKHAFAFMQYRKMLPMA